MHRSLRLNHRLRIDILSDKQKFSKLDQYLAKISEKGFDVAGVPFRVLNQVLSSGAEAGFLKAIPLARHTLGGQPRLYTAILTDLANDSPSKLCELVSDASAHPMTRFEAMGWAAFLRHREHFPTDGTKSGDVFQFWDKPSPPPEVQEGLEAWRTCSPKYIHYDEESARGFIAETFGNKAANEFTSLWHPALKSDLFRLYRLAHSGGVYCDADSEPGYRVPEFLQLAGSKVWASSMTNVPNCVVNNWFIAAPPKSQLIEGLLEFVLENIREPNNRGIFWLSGPGAFTTFLYLNLGKFDIGLLSQGALKSELLRQFDADYKHTEQNWRVFEHKAGLDNKAGLEWALKGALLR